MPRVLSVVVLLLIAVALHALDRDEDRRPLPGGSAQPYPTGGATAPAGTGDAPVRHADQPAPVAQPAQPPAARTQPPGHPSPGAPAPMDGQPSAGPLAGRPPVAPLPSIQAPGLADLDTWRLRATRLPRLAADLTTGTLAPRPLGPDYRLRAGDRVRIVTWGGVALNDVVLVDATGALAAPGFGAIPVAGKTQVEAQQLLTELVRSHFKQAGASLGVELPNAVAVTVVGEVVAAGLHNLPAGATLLEALSAAGGVRDQGSLRRLRVQPPGGAPVEVDLYRMIDAGEPAGLDALASGTFVFVPLRGPEVHVFGAVRREAAVELLPDQTLAEALRLAGGFAADAETATLRLVREGDDGQTMRQLAAIALATETARDGDRLIVAHRADLAQGRRTVTVLGQVRSPGMYAFEDGLTVGRLIDLAGGLLPEANPEHALVRRLRETPAQVDQGAGLSVPIIHDLLAPVARGTPLAPRDELTIPAFSPRENADLRVRVSGAVRLPGPIALTPQLTAQQALLLAGGVTADAQLNEADLVRVAIRPDGARDVTRIGIDLRAILQGEPGPTLQARDEIVVRTRNDQRLVVAITGEVNNSGSFTVPNGTTLRELFELAGGMTEDAFVPGIRLFRETERLQAAEYLNELRNRLQGAVAVNKRQLAGTTTETDTKGLEQTIIQQENELVRLQHAQATGRMLGIDFAGLLGDRPEADLPLQSGDRIEVPAKPGAIRIFGEVMNPGSLRYDPHLRVETVIARAGGFGQQADRKRVFVVRADGAVVANASSRGTEWDASKRNWITTKLDRIVLREGDTVIVPPDLTYKRSKLEIAKDITQVLFQIAVTAATVVVISG